MDKAEMLTWANARGVAVAILDRVVTLGDADVLCAAALNPTLPSGTRHQLSHHDAPRVRAAAVKSGLLDTSRVDELAADDDARVRTEVASANVSSSVLDRLADDPVPSVRAAASGNDRLALETLHARLADDDQTVREAAEEAAKRRGVTVEASEDALGRVVDDLMMVMQSSADDEKASENLDAIFKVRSGELDDAGRADAIGSPESKIREALASRDDLDAGEQVTLSIDADPSVRAALAGNPVVIAPVATTLAGDPDDFVRAALAEKTPHVAVQKTLAVDTKAGVRARLATRKDVDVDVVVQLCGDGHRDVRRRAVVNHPGLGERLDGVPVSELIEWNVSTWPDRLAVLCGDRETTESARSMAGSFPGTLSALAKLARAMRS